jgi:hypothetical protein
LDWYLELQSLLLRLLRAPHHAAQPVPLETPKAEA